jgi:hypothetical protein
MVRNRPPPGICREVPCFQRVERTPIPLPHTANRSTARRKNVLQDSVDALRSIPSRVQTSLALWFYHSTLRVLALEILHFPLRMSACVTNPDVERGGVTIWSAQRDRSVGNWDQESKYQSDCTRYIQELQEKFPWVGALDLNIVAQGHRAGALWALDTLGNGTHSTEQTQPSENQPSAQLSQNNGKDAQ